MKVVCTSTVNKMPVEDLKAGSTFRLQPGSTIIYMRTNRMLHNGHEAVSLNDGHLCGLSVADSVFPCTVTAVEEEA